MKIYIATSWKMEAIAKRLAEILKSNGHEVDCFCDPSSGRYVFHWSEVETDRERIDAISFLYDPRTRRAFEEDKRWLDWCDAVVMILPCGKSAHLEAGYAVGCGKPVYAWGTFPRGEFDVMYGFFSGMFREDELDALLTRLG